MKNRFLVVLLAALGAATVVPAFAGVNAALRFVSEHDYVPVDEDGVWDRINAALPGDPDALFLPAAGLGPIPVALLALQSSEPALERVRYRLRYRMADAGSATGDAPSSYSYVEVVRFNLGPAIRQDLVDAIGEEAVAGAEEFGVGPHVAWRIVTRPVMGNRAIVVAAGRREIEASQAQVEACLGAPCADAVAVIETAVEWGDMVPVTDQSVGAGDAAVEAVTLLLGEVDGSEMEPGAGSTGDPAWAIEAVVDVNLGQDEGVDAAYRQGGLMDDSVAALWQRLAIFGTGPEPAAFRANAYECRRGGGFAAPGGLCP